MAQQQARARGFASMDAAKQKEIASKGGKAAHLKGTAHEFTPEEARIAGRKGGEAVSRDSKHMAQIGAEGGRARSGARAKRMLEQQQSSQQPATPSAEEPEADSESTETPKVLGVHGVEEAVREPDTFSDEP